MGSLKDDISRFIKSVGPISLSFFDTSDQFVKDIEVFWPLVLDPNNPLHLNCPNDFRAYHQNGLKHDIIGFFNCQIFPLWVNAVLPGLNIRAKTRDAYGWLKHLVFYDGGKYIDLYLTRVDQDISQYIRSEVVVHQISQENSRSVSDGQEYAFESAAAAEDGIAEIIIQPAKHTVVRLRNGRIGIVSTLEAKIDFPAEALNNVLVWNPDGSSQFHHISSLRPSTFRGPPPLGIEPWLIENYKKRKVVVVKGKVDFKLIQACFFYVGFIVLQTNNIPIQRNAVVVQMVSDGQDDLLRNLLPTEHSLLVTASRIIPENLFQGLPVRYDMNGSIFYCYADPLFHLNEVWAGDPQVAGDVGMW